MEKLNEMKKELKNKLISHSLTFFPCIYYNGESC